MKELDRQEILSATDAIAAAQQASYRFELTPYDKDEAFFIIRLAAKIEQLRGKAAPMEPAGPE